MKVNVTATVECVENVPRHKYKGDVKIEFDAQYGITNNHAATLEEYCTQEEMEKRVAKEIIRFFQKKYDAYIIG